ncbi:MAG: hypothetical protein LBH13_10670 [Cellulomonadaceae bacterium]|jgi:hypothetical protein|nr:hypothetical protein [Cellulomonadaceae bacterium]
MTSEHDPSNIGEFTDEQVDAIIDELEAQALREQSLAAQRRSKNRLVLAMTYLALSIVIVMVAGSNPVLMVVLTVGFAAIMADMTLGNLKAMRSRQAPRDPDGSPQ